MMDLCFRPIGVIHTGHTCPEESPIQPVYARGCQGRAEVFPEYAEGLKDLDGFSNIYLIYHFHRVNTVRLSVKPFLQDVERGLFATRAPCRPNPIGLSVVELLYRKDNVLYVDGADMLDGTPLLDIKPYTARFDCILRTRNGWQGELDESSVRERTSRGYHRGERDTGDWPAASGR